MDANIVQGCDEVGTVEAEEQDVEVRTVLRLIWWTETAQNSAAAAPSPALLRRWGRSLTQDGGDLHLPPTLQLALLLTLFRVHAVLLGFAAGTLHRHGEWDTVPPPLRWGQLQTFTCSLSLLCWSTRLTCSSRHFSTLARSSQGTSWPASSRPFAASATAAC